MLQSLIFDCVNCEKLIIFDCAKMVLLSEFDDTKLSIVNIWDDIKVIGNLHADVHYNDSKFCFTLNNVRTLGIESANGKLSLLLCLDDDQAALLRKFDTRMETLLFDKRHQLLKTDGNLGNIERPGDMKFCYIPLVSQNKQLKVHVPNVIDEGEIVLDDENCRITNTEDKLCNWEMVQRGILQKVVIEVHKVFYKGKLQLNLQTRLIVPMDIGKFYYDGPNKKDRKQTQVVPKDCYDLADLEHEFKAGVLCSLAFAFTLGTFAIFCLMR